MRCNGGLSVGFQPARLTLNGAELLLCARQDDGQTKPPATRSLDFSITAHFSKTCQVVRRQWLVPELRCSTLRPIRLPRGIAVNLHLWPFWAVFWVGRTEALRSHFAND